jgi:ubiquinone/menaquinone biosynthesis C-methylase UbiE
VRAFICTLAIIAQVGEFRSTYRGILSEQFTHQKQTFFDRWAPNYDFVLVSAFYQALHRRLLDYANLPARSQVLDLGCGTGKLLDRLANSNPDLQGIGVDLSPEMLRQARKANRHHPRLIFVRGNAEDLPCGAEQFDAVFNTISFLHYQNPDRVFAEVSRVLKLGGKFYLVDYVPRHQSNTQEVPLTPGGARFYSRDGREKLGNEVGLSCVAHHNLLAGVLLTVFKKRSSSD